MRLIDADILVKRLENRSNELMDEGLFRMSGTLLGAICYVHQIPTVEVSERQYGQWEIVQYADYVCSVCGECHDNKSKYCPNCGTKMS